MHSLITSYLLQNKECVLPSIGVLQIIYTPAVTDTDNSRILPPFENIIFKNEFHSTSPGLTEYIAVKKQIGQAEAENLLNNFCKDWKEKINAGERLHFEAIGSIQKNADGKIIFVQETPYGENETSYDFLQPISVDNVYQRQQTIYIPDEAVEQEDDMVSHGVVVEKSHWGIWALILFALSLVMLFYHFKDHTLSRSNIGNQHKFIIDSAGATYEVPGK